MTTITESLKTCIRKSIERVPKGCIFDAHSIIDVLQLHHKSVYKEEAERIPDIREFHREISTAIKDIVEKENIGSALKQPSWSKHVHNAMIKNKAFIKY